MSKNGAASAASSPGAASDRSALPSGDYQAAPTVPLPSGVITLMFTDIEGSTELWERDATAFRPAFDRHNAIIRDAAERWEGREVKCQGDSFMIAFDRATSAIYCAMDIQRALSNHDWGTAIAPLVRIGLHTGEPFKGYDAAGRPDYFGPMVNRAARIADAGHGGQTLLSSATRDVVQGALSTDLHLPDLGHHRLRGIDLPEQIFELRYPDLVDPATGAPKRFPPLRTQDALRSNLPTYSTTFVGRNRELPELVELLSQPDTRLLTVIGFGGMGKTRLALQLAERCRAEYSDGAWWVELEESRSADAMIQRIAYHVGLYLQPEPSVREQLFHYLKPRHLLLVLDNVEQVPDAAGAIHDLLQAAPLVKCVVTSRRALGIRAERVKEILPLALADATNLFVDRACAQIEFEMTGENARDVEELCRRVEGVPLAIELAASRAVSMSPREIVKRLGERFTILQSDAPDLPPRQRALRAAIDWSHDLLATEDQTLFAQLAVFAGGFTLDDAEAVCDEPDIVDDHRPETLDIVARLRSHSLLRSEVVPQTQQTRYFMLEALRDYAGEKLGADHECDTRIHENHAHYFLAFMQERIAHLRDGEATGAIAEMEAAFDNARTAMDWCERHARWASCARLALAIGGFLQYRGFGHEASRRLQIGRDALERAEGELPIDEYSRLKAAFAREQAGIHLDHFEWQAAREQALAARELFTAVGDARGAAHATNLLGLSAKAEVHYDQAREYFQSALQGFQNAGDQLGIAHVFSNLGLIEYGDANGDRARAAAHWERALRAYRSLEDKRGIAQALTNLGALAHEENRADDAWRLHREALRWERELHHALGVARALSNLGEVAEVRDQLERAIRLYGAAQCLFNKIGSPYEEYTTNLLDRARAQSEATSTEPRPGADQENDELCKALKEKTLEDLVHWALAGDE
jgi:predicted ATPase/class 3 adenylate cyclase